MIVVALVHVSINVNISVNISVNVNININVNVNVNGDGNGNVKGNENEGPSTPRNHGITQATTAPPAPIKKPLAERERDNRERTRVYHRPHTNEILVAGEEAIAGPIEQAETKSVDSRTLDEASHSFPPRHHHHNHSLRGSAKARAKKKSSSSSSNRKRRKRGTTTTNNNNNSNNNSKSVCFFLNGMKWQGVVCVGNEACVFRRILLLWLGQESGKSW
mmetsp:Transcript_29637/g.69704  ORF Transcript_29637/g.69704 Transcript_29637/m.69704 type:complete len:218 (+) Transcript_29637:261-914(+)